MAFDPALAERIRQCLSRWRGIAEKKMFGGVCFMLNGNFLVGVWQSSLIVRVGPDRYEEVLVEDYVAEFDITGRPMKGWVMVLPEGIETDGQLHEWIEHAGQFVETLPTKR